MTKPITVAATKLLIMLGDGAGGSEAFVAPCGITTKGLNFSAETTDFTTQDCADPEAVEWKERVITSLSSSISGSGHLATEDLDTWRAWFLSAAAKNCRVKINVNLANNGGWFSGSYVLTQFNFSGEGRDRVGVTVEMQSSGAVTWADALA